MASQHELELVTDRGDLPSETGESISSSWAAVLPLEVDGIMIDSLALELTPLLVLHVGDDKLEQDGGLDESCPPLLFEF